MQGPLDFFARAAPAGAGLAREEIFRYQGREVPSAEESSRSVAQTNFD